MEKDIEMDEKQKRLRGQVKDLCNVEEGLSEWEVNFVNDMYNWQGDYHPKQEKKIDELYMEHC